MSNGKKLTIINVKNIPCYCSIGIAAEEKKMGQELIVDISLEIDSTKASQTDNVTDTVSYVDVYQIVQKTGKSKSFSLIETLSEEIAAGVLKLALVHGVRVKVHKPHIPYKDFQGNVSVEVERKK